jgi:hypothetical protein
MNVLKELEDFFLKGPLQSLSTDLHTNETANIAVIEADLGPSGDVATAVGAFLTGKIKSANPVVNEIEQIALPEVDAMFAEALGDASTSVPVAYAAGLARFDAFIATL